MPQTDTTPNTELLSQTLFALLKKGQIDDLKSRLSNLNDAETETVKSEFIQTESIDLKTTLFTSIVRDKNIGNDNKKLLLQSMIDKNQVGEWGLEFLNGEKRIPFYSVLKSNILLEEKKPLLQSMLDNNQVGEWGIEFSTGEKWSPFYSVLKFNIPLEEKKPLLQSMIDNNQVGEWGIEFSNGTKKSTFYSVLNSNIPLEEKKPLLQFMIDNNQVGEWGLEFLNGEKQSPFYSVLISNRTFQKKTPLLQFMIDNNQVGEWGVAFSDGAKQSSFVTFLNSNRTFQEKTPLLQFMIDNNQVGEWGIALSNGTKKSPFVTFLNSNIPLEEKKPLLQSMIDNNQVGEWGVAFSDGAKESSFVTCLNSNRTFQEKTPLLQFMIDNNQVGEWGQKLPDDSKKSSFITFLQINRLTSSKKSQILKDSFPLKDGDQKEYHLTLLGLGIVAGMQASDLIGFNQNNSNIVARRADNSPVFAEQDGDNLKLPQNIINDLLRSDKAYVFQHTPLFQKALKDNTLTTLALKNLITEKIHEPVFGQILDFNVGIRCNIPPTLASEEDSKKFRFNRDVVANFIDKASKDIEQEYKNIFVKPMLEQVAKRYINNLPLEQIKSAQDAMPIAVQKITDGLFNALDKEGLKEVFMTGRNHEQLPILHAAIEHKFAPLPTAKKAVAEFKQRMTRQQAPVVVPIPANPENSRKRLATMSGGNRPIKTIKRSISL